jgi:hypothetical protein
MSRVFYNLKNKNKKLDPNKHDSIMSRFFNL